MSLMARRMPCSPIAKVKLVQTVTCKAVTNIPAGYLNVKATVISVSL